MTEKYYETFYDWVKAKFPMVVVLAIYISVVFIFGFFVPENVYCCAENCDSNFTSLINQHTPMTINEIYNLNGNLPLTPEMKYDLNIINNGIINDRLSEINKYLDSRVFSIISFLSIIIFCSFVMNHKLAQKKIFKITLFDLSWIFIIMIFMAKMIFYINSFVGIHALGCLA